LKNGILAATLKMAFQIYNFNFIMHDCVFVLYYPTNSRPVCVGTQKKSCLYMVDPLNSQKVDLKIMIDLKKYFQLKYLTTTPYTIGDS